MRLVDSYSHCCYCSKRKNGRLYTGYILYARGSLEKQSKSKLNSTTTLLHTNTVTVTVTDRASLLRTLGWYGTVQ